MLTDNHILKIQEELERNKAGYRKLPGTALRNQGTAETVYTPPQDYETIKFLMKNLVDFINDDSLSDIDNLVKLTIIHHQFENIHPFYDGNGRTGRIISILFLVIKELLDLPVLYLSRYIIRNKGRYYALLQDVRDNGNWEEWIIFILRGIEETSVQTISLIEQIRSLMADYKKRIRKELPKIYSQDLLNNLFRHPYTKIEFVEKELSLSRKTASRYLSQLVDNGFLELVKIGRSNFYLNEPLFDLFITSHSYEKDSEDVPLIESVDLNE